MRGTIIETNKAITEPILMMGAERNMTILNFMLWGVIIAGVYMHWYVVIPVIVLIVCQKLLARLAKADPFMQRTFVTNQDFLIGSDRRFYAASSPAMNLNKSRALKTVSTNQ
jgi:type IV secretory pathway TrbD component